MDICCNSLSGCTIPESPDSDFFSDWGETGGFEVHTGPGECAA